LLRHLDLSYCRISPALAASLLLRGRRLESLALNGCEGATSDLWRCLNTPPHGAPPQAAAAAAAGAGTSSSVAAASTSAGTSRKAAGGGHGDGGVDPAGGGCRALRSLSLVKCQGLGALCLGLWPEGGRLQLQAAYSYHNTPPPLLEEPTGWRRVTTPLR
jgi:hypothetical protein